MLGSVLADPLSLYMNSDRAGSGRNSDSPLTLLLAGDVMTGRGIDQVLPHSVDPQLHERYVKNAKRYLQLAEQKNGAIPNEVSYQYIWGEALEVLEDIDPDAKIINLETTVTTSGDHWANKGVHYRMHPDNTPLLNEAGIDVCVLANNHALDWGYRGLQETIQSLQQSDIQSVGAGSDTASAAEPAAVETAEGRVLVFAYGSPSAGVPMRWQAEDDRPGVNILSHLNPQNAKKVTVDIEQYRREGDLVIVSIHWGGNWGYEIHKAQREFAHRLIDDEVADLIFGHSSHHPKGMEVYNDRLILYGCGDLINDYEGIGGHAKYRPDLRLIYFPRLNEGGSMNSLIMAPMQIQRFQLRRAPGEARDWLRDRLSRECEPFGHSVEEAAGGYLKLRW